MKSLPSSPGAPPRGAYRKARGINLALGLYLLLAAIFLPTFAVFYVTNMRIAEYVQARRVEEIVRTNSSRVEAWLASREVERVHGELRMVLGRGAPPAEAPEDRLQDELERIARETEGIEAMTVFEADEGGGLRATAFWGAAAPSKPRGEDQNALASERLVRIEIQRGENRYEAISVPLKRRDSVLGVLHMEVSPDRIAVSIPDLRRSVVLGAAGMMAVVAVGVVIFFQLAVTRPIRKLIDAMQRATEGNLEAPVDVGSGEFGWLAGAFNQMIRKLKAGSDENQRLIIRIKEFNTDLQAKVQGATSELAAKNAQLEVANEKLFLTQRQMTTLEKLATLGQVSTTIAHELGTPLNAISGHLELLMADESLDAETLSRLKAVAGQVDRLTGIVRGVLRSMRVPPPRLELINVNHVIEDTADLVDPVVTKRGIKLERKLSRDLPLLQADGDQLQQVFMNLITNAIDSMGQGGKLILATSFDPSGKIRVDVTDSGAGMDESTLAKLFQPFFTTKSESPGAGVGLGLSVCNEIVKSHRGEISVRSEPGRGTSFVLLFPVAREKVAVG